MARGSICKRKDERWEGRYTAGRDPATGKPIYKNVLGKTQGEAKEKLKRAMEESRGLNVATAEQLAAFMEEAEESGMPCLLGCACRKNLGALAPRRKSCYTK